VKQVQAIDIDELDQGRIIYSIYHVSNNGKDKFRIDSESGQIETLGKLVAGEQYSITVQATDSGNKISQSILDVFVLPGPNTEGPVFLKDRYEVEISEGISVYSTVITLQAIDPENDPIAYSLVEGNINKDFIIDSSTGTILVAKPLDREEVSSYNLIVKAADKDGLFTTTSVVVTITDINDENPKFLKDEYHFKVDEGLNKAYVGKVTATDADIGENAVIVYSISDTKHFHIDSETGEIRTNTVLDYEKQKVYEFLATAQDKSPNFRLSTAFVTVEVLDIQDELPYFEKPVYEVMTPENFANRHLVQVKATDPDTVPSITYVIKKGPKSLFSVDPLTGDVKTLRALDYEVKNSYSLVIGTLENNSTDLRATCVVNIKVQDLNDNPPVFIEKPAPIRLRDSVPLGTVLTTLRAVDADGDASGNQIRYDIIGKDKAPYYFIIDPNSGILSVKDDLRKGPDSEYKVNEVQAFVCF
jgi:protocadherin-15